MHVISKYMIDQDGKVYQFNQIPIHQLQIHPIQLYQIQINQLHQLHHHVNQQISSPCLEAIPPLEKVTNTIATPVPNTITIPSHICKSLGGKNILRNNKSLGCGHKLGDRKSLGGNKLGRRKLGNNNWFQSYDRKSLNNNKSNNNKSLNNNKLNNNKLNNSSIIKNT
eukprot:64398_1